MRKITKPTKPEEDKYIFTEGIDYFTTRKTSIWGTGDKDTLQLLKKIEIHGKWLNLAAGDGRYNLNLLKKADFVVTSDIDESALSKLWHNTPDKYKQKEVLYENKHNRNRLCRFGNGDMPCRNG